MFEYVNDTAGSYPGKVVSVVVDFVIPEDDPTYTQDKILADASIVLAKYVAHHALPEWAEAVTIYEVIDEDD